MKILSKLKDVKWTRRTFSIIFNVLGLIVLLFTFVFVKNNYAYQYLMLAVYCVAILAMEKHYTFEEFDVMAKQKFQELCQKFKS